MLKIFTFLTPLEVRLTEYEKLTLFYSLITKQRGTLSEEETERVKELALSLGVPESSIESCLIESSFIKEDVLQIEADWLLATCIDMYCPLNYCPTGPRSSPSGYKICVQFANSIGRNVMDVDRILRARFAKVKRERLKLSYA